MLKAVGFAASAALFAAPLVAHDFWLQPPKFWVRAGESVAIKFLVGHGAAREQSAIAGKRISRFDTIGPQGLADRKRDLGTGGADSGAALTFARPGIYIVAMATNNASSDLPGPRFTEYATAEGLTNVLALRAARGDTNKPGRELYSRRAKTLIQVGAPGVAAQSHVIKPVGLDLEIVPLRNPYAIGGASQLPIRVLFKGRPLAGALVKLTNLAADAQPVEIRRSDAAGRAVFTARRAGEWQFNVVWSEPISDNRAAEFVTVFSSLTFGFPAQRPAH